MRATANASLHNEGSAHVGQWVCLFLWMRALCCNLPTETMQNKNPFEGRWVKKNHSVTLLRQIHSARSEALAIPRASNTKTSSWSSLGLICPHVSSEITVEVILCKYSRQPKPPSKRRLTRLDACPAVCAPSPAPLLGRSPHKNCKNDLDDQT